MWKFKGPGIAITFLKKNELGRLTANHKPYYKYTLIKTAYFCMAKQ